MESSYWRQRILGWSFTSRWHFDVHLGEHVRARSETVLNTRHARFTPLAEQF